jgi:serine/threonine protein kinase
MSTGMSNDPKTATTDRIGRYHITGEIGRGGMGVVYRGEDKLIGREVAIKTLTEATPELRERFYVEAKSGILSHPNIVTVYELGEHEGNPFIAMEFLPGESLEKILRQRGRLPVPDSISIVEQICAGLGYAHAHGLLHRDVKPANVIVLPDGRVKIVDFGIARLADRDTRLTKTDALLGTFHYIAPERLKGEVSDGRADIWSAGIMLYEMISGDLPFRGKDVSALYRVIHDPYPPITQMVEDAPEELKAVLDKALAKEAKDRYATAEEMAFDLQALGGPASDHPALAPGRPGYRSEVSSPSSPHPYTNAFLARPFTQPWRKERTLPKPRVNGVVTGKVVTPAGDDSHLDKYGRVCVEFWWDRNRPPSTPDNTLLRVAQQWAGKGWGTYFWPRVGDEVLIDFLDGDPDAPIVVGSVYNGVNMPKYDPQSEYTLSGILTRSSKGGGAANANELRFSDRMGSEQIFMNAERDLDLHVEHDWHTLVGNEEHRRITSSQYHSVGGDAQLKVAQSRTVEVDGDAATTVRGHHVESVGGSHSVTAAASQVHRAGIAHIIQAGEEVHISGKTRVIIEGGIGGICLKGPLGAISIDMTGITLEGPLRFGAADCLPPAPEPTLPDTQEMIAPQWPGDAPAGKAGT